MKRTLFYSFMLCSGLFASIAPHNVLAKDQAKQEINWSELISTDFVSDGSMVFNTNSIAAGQIIQVRFYEKGMQPMYFGNGPSNYEIQGYSANPNSGIVSVKGLRDGGISVIMNTNIRQGGGFNETITIKTNYKNYQLQILGIIQDMDDKGSKDK